MLALDPPPAPVEPRSTYVIACTPRSGSSLLCEGLARTGLAGHPAEHVQPTQTGGAISQIAAAMAATTTPNGLYGVKFHWHQFAYAAREFRRSHPPAATSTVRLMDHFLHRPAWVHLYREDTAAQAMSYYLAIYSGIFKVPNRKDFVPPGPPLRPESPDLIQVAWLEDLLITQENRWRQFFRRNRIEPLQIAYKALDRDYESVVARVLDHLAIEAPPGAVARRRPLRRQADAWSRSWIGLYRKQRDGLPAQPRADCWANMDVLRPRPTRPSAVPVRTRASSVRPGTGQPTLRYSCVVDAHPRFEYESLVWALTLLHLAKRPASDIVVHVIEGVRASHVARLRSLGIEVVTVGRFDERNPFANKLRQLASPALDVDLAVLCDCDLAFVSDPSSLLPTDAIGGKVVNGGGPQYSQWVGATMVAGLAAEALPLARSTLGLRWTYANNLNGGFLSVPRSLMPLLAEAWPRWVHWTLERRGTSWPTGERRIKFGRMFTETAVQVAFGMILAELNPPVEHLRDDVIFSTIPPFHDRGGPAPIVLHFHRRITNCGLLRTSGVDNVDQSIDAVNTLLKTKESEALLADAKARWVHGGSGSS